MSDRSKQEIQTLLHPRLPRDKSSDSDYATPVSNDSSPRQRPIAGALFSPMNSSSEPLSFEPINPSTQSTFVQTTALLSSPPMKIVNPKNNGAILETPATPANHTSDSHNISSATPGSPEGYDSETALALAASLQDSKQLGNATPESPNEDIALAMEISRMEISRREAKEGNGWNASNTSNPAPSQNSSSSFWQTGDPSNQSGITSGDAVSNNGSPLQESKPLRNASIS